VGGLHRLRNHSYVHDLATHQLQVNAYYKNMADESVLEEAMDNLREAGQRIRATQHLLRAQGMTESEDFRELVSRLSTALAMTEAAYLEARRRREM
jgi:hypothetical protein